MKTQDQILKAIGKLEGKIDGIDKQIDDGFKRVNSSLGRHDERINENEHKVDTMTGKATVVGALLGLIGAGVIALLKQ